MGDHLVSPELLSRMLAPATDSSALAVDFSPDIHDIEEATRVRVDSEGRINRIGKDLHEWDGVDAGVFRLTPAIYEAITAVTCEERDEHQISEAVTWMIKPRVLPQCVRHLRMLLARRGYLGSPSPCQGGSGRDDALNVAYDGFVSRHINRRFSRPIARLLAYTPVTPNQVSLLSFVIALGSLALFLNDHPAWAGGAVQASSIVDGVDGDLARRKNIATRCRRLLRRHP